MKLHHVFVVLLFSFTTTAMACPEGEDWLIGLDQVYYRVGEPMKNAESGVACSSELKDTSNEFATSQRVTVTCLFGGYKTVYFGDFIHHRVLQVFKNELVQTWIYGTKKENEFALQLSIGCTKLQPTPGRLK